MGQITQAEYDAVVADVKQYKVALNEANRIIRVVTAKKNSLRKALDDVSALITAQRAGEALPLIADVLDQDNKKAAGTF
jgi:capsule polysaccharide export protein KpsE/RkpR